MVYDIGTIERGTMQTGYILAVHLGPDSSFWGEDELDQPSKCTAGYLGESRGVTARTVAFCHH